MRSENHIPDVSVLTGWCKSSYSGNGDENGGSSCLEVTTAYPDVVYVRDSKNNPQGPALALPARTWTAFIDSVR